MLTILQRYLLRRLLVTFAGALAALCFVFFLGASYRLLEHDGLSLSQVAHALPLVLPFLLPYMLPIAYVISMALVYGQLVADDEALAFASLGFSPLALATPALQLGGALSLVSLLLTTTLVPRCYHLRQQVYADTYLQLASAGRGEHLSLNFLRERLGIYVRSRQDAALEGVVLSYGGPTLPRPSTLTVVAERGEVTRDAQGEAVLLLTGARATWFERTGPEVWNVEDPLLDAPPDPPISASFARLTISGAGVTPATRLKMAAYSSAELRRQADAAEERLARGGEPAALEEAARDLDGTRRERAERASVAGAPLLLAALVVPLVLLLRARSALVPLVTAIAASSVLFFVVHIFGAYLGERLASPLPLFLPWLTTAAGALALWGRR
ncbi:MAG: LptF/LptG family permease [Planctomycetota bacterium]